MKVSSASRCVEERSGKGAARRCALLLALVGQLALLAHVVLVAHVTCGADGELVHLRADVGAARDAVPARDAASAAAAGRGEADDHCLLDEDGEAACPTAHVASGEPVAASRLDRVRRRVRAPFGRPAPLYRLAPKNSPPA